MCQFFSLINTIQEFLWGYVNFALILIIGLYFTFKTCFFQFRSLFFIHKTVKALLKPADSKQGIAPWRLYFTSIGGSIGLGNIVAVISTVSLGGPGGLFWMWVAVFLGMIVKYGEVYLGIRYRQPNQNGGYDGGPMYYLNKAFRVRFMAPIFCILMCIYGVEIFQFKVIEDSLVETFHLNRWLVMAGLLIGTAYVTLGGVNRLAQVCSACMPVFLLGYTVLCIYVVSKSNCHLWPLFQTVIKSAFTGHAAVGGFVGSTMIMAAQHGMSNAVYSGDIGMGYDSVIQAETQLTDPRIQARAVIFTLLTDCFICTLTVLVVLSTNGWKSGLNYNSAYIINALRPYIPCISQLLALFFFCVGWTTILGYLAVGMKSAKALGVYGKGIYLFYGLSMFTLFSFIDQNQARLIMYFSGALIVLMNILAIFRLRKEIDFSFN